jgi:hypothetical protein
MRSNEAFGGKGERARICRKCRRPPRERRETLLQERQIVVFFERQSHISERNLARLRTLARSGNARIASLARIVLEVGLVAPYRRHRMRTLARERCELLTAMAEAGLIVEVLSREEPDGVDVDSLTAWHEWAGLPGHEP